MSEAKETGTGAGTTPPTDRLSIESALAEWEYHRAGADQGLSLGDIVPGAEINSIEDIHSNPDNGLIGSNKDKFIYNISDGFTATVVDVDGIFTIVFRGTDFSGITDVDTGDVGADIALGQGSRATSSQATDAIALTDLVIHNLAGDDRSKVRVVGQSLGGGLAGLVAGVYGLAGTLIAPAPFRADLQALAAEAALMDVGLTRDTAASYGSSPELQAFNGLTDQADADPARAISLGDVIFALYGSDVYQQFSDSFASYYTSYSANIDNPALGVHRIAGELLTSGDGALGGLIGANATQFKAATTTYDLGGGNPVALHSPTLHALEMRSIYDPGTEGEFGKLLRDDPVLHDAFVGDSIQITGAIDHARTDDPDIATGSRVGADGVSPGVMERALWKTIGESGGLYDYFYKVFDDLLRHGAAADMSAGDGGFSGATVQGGIERLALQVLRDAVANTQTVAEVEGKPGYRFVGQDGSSGTPMSDRAIIHLAQIHPQDSVLQNAPDGLPFGV